MSDLDKLLAGKEIYRHEDKRAIADKWRGWADLFQFGSLGMLFVTIFVCNSLTKAQARVIVWYFAALISIMATIGFFVSRKALKYETDYLNAESNRVGSLMDDAIDRVKRG